MRGSKGGFHYSAVSYYQLGRVYPRERLREPFPRLPPANIVAALRLFIHPKNVPYKPLRGGFYGRFF